MQPFLVSGFSARHDLRSLLLFLVSVFIGMLVISFDSSVDVIGRAATGRSSMAHTGNRCSEAAGASAVAAGGAATEEIGHVL